MSVKKFFLFIIPAIILAVILFVLFQIFILKQNEKGGLRVTASPESSVYLDGKFIGQTPLCKCPVSNTMMKTGDYSIKIVPASGTFSEYTDKISVRKNLLTVVDRTFGQGDEAEGSVISLDSLSDKTNTQLLVVSTPDKAEVSLDEKIVGKTPLLLKDIKVGKFELLLKKEGFKPKIIPIQTTEGYKLLATIQLGSDTVLRPTPVPPTPETTVSPTVSKTLTPSPSKSVTKSPTPTVKKTGTPSPPKTSPTPTKATSGQIEILDTPNGFLRVREEPTTSSAEITRLKTGDVVEYIDEQDGWYKVKLDSGETGWVSSIYVKVVNN